MIDFSTAIIVKIISILPETFCLIMYMFNYCRSEQNQKSINLAISSLLAKGIQIWFT